MDMVTLPTLLDGANITIMTDEVNSTEVVTVMSFASEATVVTPAAFACNVSLLLSFLCDPVHAVEIASSSACTCLKAHQVQLGAYIRCVVSFPISEVQAVAVVIADIYLYTLQLVIYGIDGVLVPEEAIYPFDAMTLSKYLAGTLMPGSAEVPLSLVVEAVESGETQSVAEAFMTAVDGGYLQQITALYVEATGNQEALVALAAVGNEVIQMSSCDAYTPVLEQLPSTEELQEAPSTMAIVMRSYPAFAQCATQASS